MATLGYADRTGRLCGTFTWKTQDYPRLSWMQGRLHRAFPTDPKKLPTHVVYIEKMRSRESCCDFCSWPFFVCFSVQCHCQRWWRGCQCLCRLLAVSLALFAAQMLPCFPPNFNPTSAHCRHIPFRSAWNPMQARKDLWQHVAATNSFLVKHDQLHNWLVSKTGNIAYFGETSYLQNSFWQFLAYFVGVQDFWVVDWLYTLAHSSQRPVSRPNGNAYFRHIIVYMYTIRIWTLVKIVVSDVYFDDFEGFVTIWFHTFIPKTTGWLPKMLPMLLQTTVLIPAQMTHRNYQIIHVE